MSVKRRERRIYTDEIKHQIVTLYHHGKTRAELIREYELTPSALNKWINNYENTRSFKHQDNLSDEQKRLNCKCQCESEPLYWYESEPLVNYLTNPLFL